MASPEPKAVETVQPIAAAYGIPLATHEGLREHHRDAEPFVGREEFETRLRRFFAEPHALVLGDETASQALGRFRGAVEEILAREAGDVVLATHGTVLALLLGSLGEDAFGTWRRLRFPALVTLERPTLRILDIVEEVR